MSYILDALKKSEEQRGHGSAPSVQTVHSSSLSYNASKTHLWPYILLAAVFINLAALMYFIMTRGETESSATHQQLATENSAATTVTSLATARPINPDPAEVETGSAEEFYRPISLPGTSQNTTIAAASAESVYIPRAETNYGEILEMEELPFDTQQHIPVMDFSAHVYSSNPLQRSIVINGRFMEEGDRVAADVYLNEITPDGAVFEYQGQLFSQRVVSAWN